MYRYRMQLHCSMQHVNIGDTEDNQIIRTHVVPARGSILKGRAVMALSNTTALHPMLYRDGTRQNVSASC